jgi:hypothetical protein
MVLEKTLADPVQTDPRFRQVLPSSELMRWPRNWPCWPAHFFGGITHGQL